MIKQRGSASRLIIILLLHIFVSLAVHIPVCKSLKWPRLSPKAATVGKHPKDDDGSSQAALSSLQLEPLLQVPCAIQLMKNLSDQSDKSHKRAIGAFCDTGAQRTCMSWDAAKRVGLAHLLDRRYAGQATGVGFCRVLGRIPAQTVLLHFSGAGAGAGAGRSSSDHQDITIMAPAITILESTGTEGVELLFGLDFLRDAQAVIDMEEEYLRLTGALASTKGETETTVVEVSFVRPRQSVTKTIVATESEDGGDANEKSRGMEQPQSRPSRQATAETTAGNTSNIGYDSDNEEDEGSDEEADTPMDMSGI